MVDYRAEWLGEPSENEGSGMLIERATWSADAPGQTWATASGDVLTAGPHHVWLRFWLATQGQVVDKHFDPTGAAIGWYAPITSSLVQTGNGMATETLYLGLWIDVDHRITVMGEEEFDMAELAGEMTPVEVEQAEFRIRQLTTAVAARRFPPALIRNFSLTLSAPEANVANAPTAIETGMGP